MIFFLWRNTNSARPASVYDLSVDIGGARVKFGSRRKDAYGKLRVIAGRSHRRHAAPADAARAARRFCRAISPAVAPDAATEYFARQTPLPEPAENTKYGWCS